MEEQARKEGWVPKEEWAGNPDQWVDAETFIKRGEEILPIARKKWEAENAALRADLENVKKTAAEFREFQETILENTNKKHAEEVARLKAEKKQAAKDGDLDAVVGIEEQIEQLEAVKPAPKKPEQPNSEDARVFNEWLSDNEWYRDNRRLKAFADGYAQQIAGQYQGRTFLEKLTEEVKEAFPDQFKNPNRSRKDVDGGSPPPKSNGRTYDDLPADAKAACDRFVQTIKGFTVEKYLETYEWD